MEEKILKIISKINLQKISDRFLEKDLNKTNSLSKILIKENSINFAIDIGILKIDSKVAQNLLEKLKSEISKNKKFQDKKINIILTSGDQNPSQTEEKQPEKTENIKESKIKGVKKIIAVASGKGGVGKSTIAANLALSLQKIGFKIGLADADIYGPSIAYLMNLKGKPENEGNLMLPIKNYGVNCISIGSLVEAKKATVWRGPMASKALNQLIAGTKWPDIDILIIDLPPGTGDVHLSLVKEFQPDGAVIVSTPQNLAVIDVVKAIDMFDALQVPILGMVQNMAFLEEENGKKNYIFGQDGSKKLAKNLKIEFLGEIALDPKINEANDEQEPICHSQKSGEIAFEFGKIAENLIDQLNKT